MNNELQPDRPPLQQDSQPNPIQQDQILPSHSVAAAVAAAAVVGAAAAAAVAAAAAAAAAAKANHDVEGDVQMVDVDGNAPQNQQGPGP
uniref:Uncharacterized protein n=1 Tax=Chromera velia CCMP2878 TaxID=1169474 RepID=A0A0G4HX88_9ALVE|eukprot:Cvel_9236.t1-p1 / transcript=Cvel_9236.t1 / gene=Cvel_9236 / organism=Chromera_velia_CCMP2878 / gene_product=hypothetical protein / transcript_product=hypothetical protein / location=Cvel_scaffold527:41671-41934(-) / protein_length=88 / sequence_SO=supercontig / SO=protein_coding / is_pseudo=false